MLVGESSGSGSIVEKGLQAIGSVLFFWRDDLLMKVFLHNGTIMCDLDDSLSHGQATGHNVDV